MAGDLHVGAADAAVKGQSRNTVTRRDLNLMLRPSMAFDQKSAFAMELDGACISLNDVRNRFGDLELTQHPRGRSLQETTVWSVQREWGTLSFAFKEDRPTCLFRVSFRK